MPLTQSTGRVVIPGMLRRFLERASLAYAGTRDRALTPHFHWVCGWALEPDPDTLAFFLAEPFPDRFLQDARECTRVALTIEHIGPHETYQFKGELLGTRAPGPREVEISERCRERFVCDVQTLDARYGFASEALALYHGRPALIALLLVQEIFLQTPGPGAGRRLAPPEPA